MGSSPAVLTNAVWALAHQKKAMKVLGYVNCYNCGINMVQDEIAMKLMEEMV